MPEPREDLFHELLELAASRLSAFILYPRGPIMKACLRLFERVGLVVML